MKSARFAATAALGLTTVLVSALLGAAPAAAASSPAAPATWTLTPLFDGGQSICTEPAEGRWSLVYVLIKGTWSSDIEVGVSDLPSGSDTQLPPPLAPGSNPRRPGGTVYINTAVNVYAPPLPVGSYPAEVWASDGVETQTIPFRISAQKDDC